MNSNQAIAAGAIAALGGYWYTRRSGNDPPGSDSGASDSGGPTDTGGSDTGGSANSGGSGDSLPSPDETGSTGSTADGSTDTDGSTDSDGSGTDGSEWQGAVRTDPTEEAIDLSGSDSSATPVIGANNTLLNPEEM